MRSQNGNHAPQNYTESRHYELHDDNLYLTDHFLSHNSDEPTRGFGFEFADDGGFSVGNFLPWGTSDLLGVWGEFYIGFHIQF